MQQILHRNHHLGAGRGATKAWCSGPAPFTQARLPARTRNSRRVLAQRDECEGTGYAYSPDSRPEVDTSGIGRDAPSSSTLPPAQDDVSMELGRLQAFAAYRQEVSKFSTQAGSKSSSKQHSKQRHSQQQQGPDLLRCAALIAKATKYPQLNVDEVVAEIDWLAAEVEKQLPPEGSRYPLRVIRTMIEVLYHQKGFHGNAVDYYEDDNSFINMVLLNKAGIPITLSLLFMEVSGRCGMPMVGVNLPSHFMIQPDIEDMEVLVDAFAGEVLFVEDAEARLAGIMGMDVKIDPALIKGRKGVPPHRFLMRLLNNLKQIYVMTNQTDLALRVIRLMRVTDPTSLGDVRDEGLCLYNLKRYSEAVTALSEYLQAQPQAEDALMVYTVLEGCQQIMKDQQRKQQQQ